MPKFQVPQIFQLRLKPSQSFRFLDLPKEIRLMIYELLPKMITKRMPIDHSSPMALWDHWAFRSRAPAWYWHRRTYETAILRTCRQIYHEAQLTITLALWHPKNEPLLHFSSYGFSITEMIFEVNGNTPCCNKHGMRKVQSMIEQREQGLMKRLKARGPDESKWKTAQIDYYPLAAKGRTDNERFDLVEDMAALELLLSQPEYTTNIPKYQQSILGDQDMAKPKFEQYHQICLESFSRACFAFLLGRENREIPEIDLFRFYYSLGLRTTPRYLLPYGSRMEWRSTKRFLRQMKMFLMFEVISIFLFAVILHYDDLAKWLNSR